MSAPVFLVEALPAGDVTVLDGAEGRHAAAVRRLQPGERVDLSDGAGAVAECRVTAVRRDELELAVIRRHTVSPPAPRLVVVQALAKGDRGELAVELMTEAGVDEIVPWQASRSVARWKSERGEKALARWRSTAREAAKQSRRAFVPTVAPLASTPEVARRLAAVPLGVALHEEASEPLVGLSIPPAGEVLLVVGPEGGVSPDELAAFAAAGARVVRLGPTVFRTSTAGVAALCVLSARTDRWG